MLESYRRVIWLDSDILVQKSLDELFDGTMLTATKDSPWHVGDNFLAAVEGYDMNKEGLCSAVLGLSDRLPYLDLYNWCFNEAARLSHILYNRDQGIFNLALQCFDIKIRWLSVTKWQCMPWQPEAPEAHIVHFGGHQKPWENPDISEQWPAWQKYYAKWIELGGSAFQALPTMDISSKKFIAESRREKYLRLESEKIDKRLKSIEDDARREIESTSTKIQRCEHTKPIESSLRADCPWIVPLNRRVHALKNVFQSGGKKSYDDLFSLDANKPQLAAVFGGGLGDALKFTSILPRLVQKLGCEVTVFCDQQAVEDIKSLNPYITNFCFISGNPYDFVEQVLQYAEVFDGICIYRYTVRFIFHPRSRFPCDLVENLSAHSENCNAKFNRYNFSNVVWPGVNNAFAREMGRHGQGVLQTLSSSLGLGYSEAEVFLIPLFLPQPEDESLNPFLSAPYVTIHHGFDVRKLPARSKQTDYSSTKNLTAEKWADIVSCIRLYGLKVIQLGTPNEQTIKGIDYDLTGATLAQTAMLLKNALCHLDTEGGLVHLNRAVHGTSVVMFGPTPVRTFGYPQNVNLAPSPCKECFWTTQTWVLECPLDTAGPECMAVYEPERVAATVATTVAGKTKIGVELVESSTYLNLQSLPEWLRRFWPGMENALSASMAICSEAGLEGLKDALGEFGAAFHIYTTDVSDPALLIKTHSGARIGSFINLNMECDEYEVVLCVTETWAGVGGPFIMSEMLRVLKPGGLLIGICPGPSNQIPELKSLFKDYRIEAKYSQDIGGVSSFAFRKEYIQKCPVALPKIRHLPYRDQYPSSPAKFSKRVEELHEAANMRLDKAYDHYNIWAENVAKAWEVSDRVIRSSLPEDGWISVSSKVAESYGPKFLLKGWYAPEDWGTWGQGLEHSLILPMDAFVSPTESFIFEAELNVRLSPELPRRKISVRLNKTVNLEAWAEREQLGCGDPLVLKISVRAQEALIRRFVLLDFELDSLFVPRSINPESRDDRAIGIGLICFRYKVSRDLSPLSNHTEPAILLSTVSRERKAAIKKRFDFFFRRRRVV